MSTILPGKFEHGDFVAWLREFDACSAANGWKVTDDTDEKILKLPAFLRGQAASHFHVIPSAQRASYADAIAALKQAMCPAAHRENFYAEFESRTLRSGEDPAVYRWELGNLLSKADPTLSPDATTALISQQYMRGLPYALKLKLLEHNPIPTLEQMLSFTQRYGAVEGYVLPNAHCSTSSTQSIASTTSETTAPTSSDPQLSQLVAMVAGIAEKQLSLEDRLSKNEEQRNSKGNRPSGTCFACGGLGHFARDCHRSNARRKPPGNVRPLTCFSCGKIGHFARDCRNQAHLNY